MEQTVKDKLIAIFTNHEDDVYCFRKELIEGLAAKGYQILIACPYGNKLELMKHVNFTYIDTPIDRRGTNPIADLKLMRQYAKIIKKRKPDVVLTYTIKPNIYGGMMCSMLHTPYIPHITGLGSAVENGGVMQKAVLTLYRIGLKKSDCVFFQNTKNENFMSDSGIASGKHVLVPGSGVNIKLHCLEEYPEVNSEIRILFIGRIMKEKGVNELLESAEIIKKKFPRVQFDLVGWVEEEYQQILKAYQDRGIINYHGRQNDVHSFIKRSHATVLPSYHEGMSNVLLESASTGRPVLASNIAGCKETFDEGISGFGFEKKNVDDLVDKLEKFIELPYEKKKAMGLAGRIKVERQFDRDIVVNSYMKEIERICRKPWGDK